MRRVMLVCLLQLVVGLCVLLDLFDILVVTYRQLDSLAFWSGSIHKVGVLRYCLLKKCAKQSCKFVGWAFSMCLRPNCQPSGSYGGEILFAISECLCLVGESASFLRECKVNFFMVLHLTIMHFGKCYAIYAYAYTCENFVVLRNFMVVLDIKKCR